MLQAYMDESGIHNDSPVVTVGAYVGVPRVWRDWTKAWNKRKHPIKVFHANDCANLWGEFEGWDKKHRDSFVAKLLPTIADHQIAAFVSGIRMNDFREVCAVYPHVARIIKTPYTACFQWVVQDILMYLNAYNDTQKVAIFHEVNEFRSEALECFDFVRKLDGYRRIMSISFGSKQSYTPLQAADILAYEANKRFRNPKGRERRAWQAINPSGARRNSRYFDKASLMAFAKAVPTIDPSETAQFFEIAAQTLRQFHQRQSPGRF
ncbi:MAG: DUF3800 domain-containing protein [Propylenella sp.]